jgi:hypothetical protein
VHVIKTQPLFSQKSHLLDISATSLSALMHPWLETAFSGKKTSNTFREFIIYDNLQAFPAYIIYYAREY